MSAQRISRLALIAVLALGGCGKPSAAPDAIANANNDPAEEGAAEIEAKANQMVKAKIVDLDTYTAKQAAAVAAPEVEVTPEDDDTSDLNKKN